MKTGKNDGREPFLRRLVYVLGDKGFYIVLFLCVAVIGLTAWLFSTAWSSTKLVEDQSLGKRVTAPPAQTDSYGADMAAGDFRWLPEPVPPATAAPKDAQPAEQDQGDTAPVEAGDGSEAVPVEADNAGKPAAEAMATVFLWPVSGELAADYSVEALAYDRTMADWRTHAGIDVAAPLGEKVTSSADGMVERIHLDPLYGVTVTIYHGGGLRSVYANLAGTPTVQTGDEVRMGDVIGAVGDTAAAEAGDVTHLHFTMTLDEQTVDPLDYLPAR